MVRQRKEKKAKDLKLRQPDRTGPTEKTLLQLAEERNLFDMADKQQRKNTKPEGPEGADKFEDKNRDGDGGGLSSSADRVMDTLLYAVCLAMLHFTLDYLIQQQYAMEMDYKKITERTFQALMVFAALVHALHPHPANTTFIPGVPRKYHYGLRQAIFFIASLASGCYLIHISNNYSYMAVMKQSPPLGCLWIWSVIEMDLLLSLLSLAGSYSFFWYNGYKL